jgi:hypothetical protein
MKSDFEYKNFEEWGYEQAGEDPLVPSTASVVKLEKPLLAMICATLKPALANGVVFEVTELEFSRAEPPTAGSTRGTTPLRAAVVGKVGSSQMLGTLTTKGLKFCSAATRPLAAEMTWGSVPSSETIKSAWVS